MATKRLKEILEARKSSGRDNSGISLCLSALWKYFLHHNWYFESNNIPIFFVPPTIAGMNGTSPGSHVRSIHTCPKNSDICFEHIPQHISFVTQMSEKSLQKWLDQELEVMVHVHEVRNEYEKQSQLYVLCVVQFFSQIFVADIVYIFYIDSWQLQNNMVLKACCTWGGACHFEERRCHVWCS